MALGGLSPVVFLGLGILGLGTLLHIVGTATPAWTVAEGYFQGSVINQEVGPFKRCSETSSRYGDVSRCISIESGDGDGDVEAVRAFCIIGILVALLALLVAIIMIVMALLGKGVNKLFPLLTTVASLGAFAAILLAVIIWGASVHVKTGDLGYSFGLSIGGGIACALGGVLIFFSARGASQSTTVS